jgi:hypothetical protein
MQHGVQTKRKGKKQFLDIELNGYGVIVMSDVSQIPNGRTAIKLSGLSL